MEDKLKERIEYIIEFGEKLLSTKVRSYAEFYGSYESLQDSSTFYEWETLAHSFLTNVFGEDSPHYKQFIKNCELRALDDQPSTIKRGLGVLRAAKTDIEKGYLKKIEALVAADIFTDFLDMASYLLSEGYKDPAAVMLGSILEEHLRQLCRKNSISIEYQNTNNVLIPKKADAMNADLAKANIYSKLDQKSVTAWLDLRNKAAHGKYSEYTKEQVDLMRQGITDFITRISL